MDGVGMDSVRVTWPHGTRVISLPLPPSQTVWPKPLLLKVRHGQGTDRVVQRRRQRSHTMPSQPGGVPCHIVLSGLQIPRSIGKKGVIINELRQESGASISILDRPPAIPEALQRLELRVACASGTDAQVHAALMGLVRNALGPQALRQQDSSDEDVAVLVPRQCEPHLQGQDFLDSCAGCGLSVAPLEGLGRHRLVHLRGAENRAVQTAAWRVHQLVSRLAAGGVLTARDFDLADSSWDDAMEAFRSTRGQLGAPGAAAGAVAALELQGLPRPPDLGAAAAAQEAESQRAREAREHESREREAAERRARNRALQLQYHPSGGAAEEPRAEREARQRQAAEAREREARERAEREREIQERKAREQELWDRRAASGPAQAPALAPAPAPAPAPAASGAPGAAAVGWPAAAAVPGAATPAWPAAQAPPAAPQAPREGERRFALDGGGVPAGDGPRASESGPGSGAAAAQAGAVASPGSGAVLEILVRLPTIEAARALASQELGIARRAGAKVTPGHAAGDLASPVLQISGTPVANALACYLVQEALWVMRPW
ncbi:unnamed protein product [Prorocentrum cordatum]|uniref:K Homology domain-containing protein n=1 Tax=Prorocentrum cordatum TaxID=2364126 RepID=A0ABN9QTC9_9DINO|nr:unnamed protein product [Polarella glacialis]